MGPIARLLSIRTYSYYYSIDKGFGVQGSGFRVQGSESASGACRPLIGDEREEAGSTGSEGSAGVAVHFVILSGEKRRM